LTGPVVKGGGVGGIAGAEDQNPSRKKRWIKGEGSKRGEPIGGLPCIQGGEEGVKGQDILKKKREDKWGRLEGKGDLIILHRKDLTRNAIRRGEKAFVLGGGFRNKPKLKRKGV